MKTLSIQRPRPSMLMRTLASFSTWVKRGLVNWLSEFPGAPLVLTDWKDDYNHVRPHTALRGIAPAHIAITAHFGHHRETGL